MVKISAVLDCACLIGLERIGHLPLLPALLEPVIAPPAVISEFGQRPSWLLEQAPADTGMVAALKLIVDPGESEAIALAYEKRLRLIVDDRKAREAAQRLGIPVTGTVGLLLKAKQAGLITAVLPLLDALDQHQFRISPALRAEALKLAGE
jgi:predicted nucleic acid-binding protein